LEEKKSRSLDLRSVRKLTSRFARDDKGEYRVASTEL
jgi:hypothetical protein